MFNIKEIFTTQFLFQVDRVTLHRSDKMFLWIGAILVALAILFKIAQIFSGNPVDKKFIDKIFKLVLTIGFLEVVWFGARYQNVMFFSTHAAAMLFLLVGVVWFVFIGINFLKNYSKEKNILRKELIKQKYLNKA